MVLNTVILSIVLVLVLSTNTIHSNIVHDTHTNVIDQQNNLNSTFEHVVRNLEEVQKKIQDEKNQKQNTLHQQSHNKSQTQQSHKTISADSIKQSQSNQQNQTIKDQTQKTIEKQQQNEKEQQFDKIDYLGDITNSLKSFMSNQSLLNSDLMKKLIQNTGITQKADIKQESQTIKKQQEAKEENEKEFLDNISQWVKKQKEDSDLVKKKVENQNMILESFSFYVEPGSSKKLFKYVPKGRPENYFFHVIFYCNVSGNFIIPNNPSESQFLELSIIHNGKSVDVQKIYVQKLFEWYQYLQNGNIELLFNNSVGYPLVVVIYLQRLKTIANTIKSQSIDPLAEKLKSIIDNIELEHSKNRFRSKAQIGFKQNQQSLITELLTFSGIQTVAVIATMILQLYYLQKLINNNNIMV